MGFVHAGTRLGVAKEEASATLGADRGFRDSPRFARQHGSRLIANLKPVAVFPRWERAYDLPLLIQRKYSEPIALLHRFIWANTAGQYGPFLRALCGLAKSWGALSGLYGLPRSGPL